MRDLGKQFLLIFLLAFFTVLATHRLCEIGQSHTWGKMRYTGSRIPLTKHSGQSFSQKNCGSRKNDCRSPVSVYSKPSLGN